MCGGSLFPFLGPTADTLKQPTFKEGDQCITPHGPAKVVATAYLKLESLFRQFGRTEGSPKPLEFPHAEGTVIEMPLAAALLRSLYQ
jgi:hypothetical protein